MAERKIVCLGAGSLYFPRALGDFALTPELSGSEIVLYDIDAEKSALMAELGRRLSAESGVALTMRATMDLADALDGADFALSSIGGSGAEVTPNVYDSYYHAADVHIPAKYGISQVIGDTCGPAGMMMGLRSVPAYLAICREMERRCPNVIVFNHSNPMAVICRAMNRYTSINFVGICHGVQIGFHHIAEILGVAVEQLQGVWIGTNHYYWFVRLMHHGKDVYPEVMRRLEERRDEHGRSMSNQLSLAYRHKIVYPEDDHIIEFYPYLTQLCSVQDLPEALRESAKAHGFDTSSTMPERVLPTPVVRDAFLSKYRQILNDVKLPEDKGTPLTGEGIADIISAIALGNRQVCIVNIPNGGIVPNLSQDAILEVEGVTDSGGVRGLQIGQCPVALKGILEKRFAWQELVADAAVTGDRHLALQALLMDEMSIPPDRAEAMLDELLAASADLLPQFER